MVPLLVLAFALSYRDWSDPNVVLTRFLEAWYEQDLDEVYDHLCAADQAHRSLEKYINLYGTEDSIVVAPLFERSTFEIESLELKGAHARARVTVKEPDMSVVLDDVMNEAFRAIGSGANSGDFDGRLARRYAHKRVPMKTTQKVYSLVREEDGWRVDLHWPVATQVGSLLLSGAAREERGDFEGARDDYETALALDDTQIDLLGQIERVSVKMLPRAEQLRRSEEAMDAIFYEILRR